MSPAYAFTVEQLGASCRIELIQCATGRVKVFEQARGCAENLSRHMASLTDTQCADWFKRTDVARKGDTND